MRVLGLEPKTYGLKSRQPENVTTCEIDSYQLPEKYLTAYLTENPITIQRDLQRITNRWTVLPPNIRVAILTLVGGDEDE